VGIRYEDEDCLLLGGGEMAGEVGGEVGDIGGLGEAECELESSLLLDVERAMPSKPSTTSLSSSLIFAFSTNNI